MVRDMENLFLHVVFGQLADSTWKTGRFRGEQLADSVESVYEGWQGPVYQQSKLL